MNKIALLLKVNLKFKNVILQFLNIKKFNLKSQKIIRRKLVAI